MFWLTFQWSRLSLWLPAKIVAVHFGCLPVWIYGGVSLSKDWWLVWVAVAYCWGVLSYDFCITFCTTAHPLSPRNLSFRKSREICGEGERTGFSKIIPLRVVFLQCVMYNTCTGVCNKQQGGVVRSPTGRPWSSAPRQANPIVSNIDFAYSRDPTIPVASKTISSLTICVVFSCLYHFIQMNEIRNQWPWVTFEAFKCLELGFTEAIS